MTVGVLVDNSYHILQTSPVIPAVSGKHLDDLLIWLRRKSKQRVELYTYPPKSAAPTEQPESDTDGVVPNDS